MNQNTELLIIVPVYNEATILKQFTEDWIATLRPLTANFELHFYNDGSRDNSELVLLDLKNTYPEVYFFSKENTGHGPTITQAYSSAKKYTWIFQIDSDHELPVNHFNELWINRDNYDLLLGKRINRNSSTFRKALTLLASICVTLLSGKGITDINIPYRLIRGEKLQSFLLHNNPQNFAPNVMMSAYAIRHHWRIMEMPIVPLQTRQLKKRGYSLYLLKGGISTALELLRFAFRR